MLLLFNRAWGMPKRNERQASASSTPESQSVANPSDSNDTQTSASIESTVVDSIPVRPKRAASAYNLFFCLERERLLSGETRPRVYTIDDAARAAHMQRDGSDTSKKKRKHVRTHGKIGFSDMSKTIARLWNNTDESTRKVFEAQAAIELREFRRKFLEWKRQLMQREQKATLEKENSSALPIRTNTVQNESSISSSFSFTNQATNRLLANLSVEPDHLDSSDLQFPIYDDSSDFDNDRKLPARPNNSSVDEYSSAFTSMLIESNSLKPYPHDTFRTEFLEMSNTQTTCASARIQSQAVNVPDIDYFSILSSIQSQSEQNILQRQYDNGVVESSHPTKFPTAVLSTNVDTSLQINVLLSSLSDHDALLNLSTFGDPFQLTTTGSHPNASCIPSTRINLTTANESGIAHSIVIRSKDDPTEISTDYTNDCQLLHNIGENEVAAYLVDSTNGDYLLNHISENICCCENNPDECGHHIIHQLSPLFASEQQLEIKTSSVHKNA